MCLLQYDGKFKHTYRLCIITETFPSEGDHVRPVKVGFRPKKQCKAGPYKSVSLEELPQAHTNHVLTRLPSSSPMPSIPMSVGGVVVEELGGEMGEGQDQTRMKVFVTSRLLMTVDSYYF